MAHLSLCTVHMPIHTQVPFPDVYHYYAHSKLVVSSIQWQFTEGARRIQMIMDTLQVTF